MSVIKLEFIAGESVSGRKGTEEGHWYVKDSLNLFDGVGNTQLEALWALAEQQAGYIRSWNLKERGTADAGN